MSNKAAAILAASAVLVGVLIGRASADTGTKPAPEPKQITGQALDPKAYPRTKQGAATAAQAYSEAGMRAVFMSSAEGRAVIDAFSSDAMRDQLAKELEEATAAFSKLFDLPNGEGQVVNRSAPLGYRVVSFTKDSARVEIWTATVFGKPGVGNGIAPIFKTATLDLAFERGAWRLAGLPQSKDGPTPIADNPEASSSVLSAVKDLQEFSHAAR